MENNFGNLFGGMCSVLPKGDCRLALNGLIAVNVNIGGTPQYRTYDPGTGILTNCADFAMDLDDSFYLIPTAKVKTGDIIVSGDSPFCVIEAGKKSIRAFSYRRGTIEELVPEHMMFLGNCFCYRKVFSPLAGMLSGNKGMKNMVKMMVLSRMFGGGEKTGTLGGLNPLALMLLSGGGEKGLWDEMLGDTFAFEDEEEKEDT